MRFPIKPSHLPDVLPSRFGAGTLYQHYDMMNRYLTPHAFCVYFERHDPWEKISPDSYAYRFQSEGDLFLVRTYDTPATDRDLGEFTMMRISECESSGDLPYRTVDGDDVYRELVDIQSRIDAVWSDRSSVPTDHINRCYRLAHLTCDDNEDVEDRAFDLVRLDADQLLRLELKWEVR